jgi:hypothetical protein
LQALARKANAEGRLVTIFDVGEFKYIDDVEALALLGPLALTSLAGIRKKHLPLLHRINIDGARVRFVARAGCAELLALRRRLDARVPLRRRRPSGNAQRLLRLLPRRVRTRPSHVQTLMTLFTDAGFTYTIPWLTALCNDLQIHVERKDAAFAAADEAPPAPKPAAKPAKPAKAERSPLRRALVLGPLFAFAT